MANPATKTIKKTVKKASRTVLKGSVAYAKACAFRGLLCWGIAALIAYLPSLGIHLPSMFTGQDTVASLAFIIAGIVMFNRGISFGRLVHLIRTFM